MINNKRTRQQWIYVATDYVVTNFAWLIFNITRFWLLPKGALSHSSLGSYLTSTTVALGQVVFPLIMMGVYWLSGYYNKVFYKSRAEELTTTLSSSLINALIIFFAVLLNDMTDDLKLDWGLFLLLFALLFSMVYTGRWLNTRAVIKRLNKGEISFNTVVVGDPKRALEFINSRSAERFMGFRIKAIVTVDSDQSDHMDQTMDEVKILSIDQLPDYVRCNAIENIVVLPLPQGREATLRMINRLFPLECRLYVHPDEFEMLVARPRTSNIVGDPLIDISRSEIDQSTQNIKRLSDVVISAVILILLSPLLLILTIAVRLDSPGPAFYRQRRIGYHKRPFDIIKFRTMDVNAEQLGPQLSQGDNDPRITRLGRIMRKYRLDELPQFFNVLRGEMSIVGPRPEREHYITRIMEKAPYYALLHQVRPGITSWGMVRYGYASDVDQMIQRLKFDILYLENVSFAVDMKIVFYTISTVLKGKGQ